jgi:cytoskeleton protein RodZ
VIAWWQSNFIIKNQPDSEPAQTQVLDIQTPEPSLDEISNETNASFSSLPINFPEVISSPAEYIIDGTAVDADEGILPEFIENLENIPIAEESSLININQQLDESLETIFASDLANESDLSSTTNEPFEPDTLDIYISSDSWIEIFDVNEQKIYFDLARTGDQLSLNGTAPFDVILGFAQGVTIELNGQPFDQSPYTRGGVARFKLEE